MEPKKSGLITVNPKHVSDERESFDRNILEENVCDKTYREKKKQ